MSAADRRGPAWVGALILAAACASPPGDDPAVSLDIAEATARAAEQRDSPYLGRAKADLFRAYMGALLACAVPQKAHVQIALAIGADGHVEGVFVAPEGHETECVQRKLRKAQLPPPPEAPFYHAIDVTTDLLW